MDRISQLWRDPQKLSLLMAAMFFVGILFSAYFLFALPDAKAGTHANAFVVVGITFGFGVLAIHQAMRIKREVIVFKEKTTDLQQEQTSREERALAVDLQAFKKEIGNKKGTQAWQAGLQAICDLVQAGQGALYKVSDDNKQNTAELVAGFALLQAEGETIRFSAGEGLIGQALASGKNMYLDELPEGYQQQIVSGLGKAAPKYIFIAAIKKENQVKAILEVATFTQLSEQGQKQAEEMAQVLLEKI